MAKAGCRMEKGAEWPTFRASLPSAGLGLNLKPEGRPPSAVLLRRMGRPKESRSPKSEPADPCNRLAAYRIKRFSDFEFRPSFRFRFSTFGFQCCPPCSRLWCGLGVALGWLWGAYQVAINTLWGGFEVALMWLWAALPAFSAFIILPSAFAPMSSTARSFLHSPTGSPPEPHRSTSVRLTEVLR
jgi:hypothetical protein